MSQAPKTIPKNPALKPAEDFYRLRREGIGFIEQMGSRLWTDYNTHDPGITILEALCYALTDLAYRTGWDIKDILTAKTDPSSGTEPYPHQAFFTAREILTVNPTTPDDYRRLLIDLDMVRNAWLFCKDAPCDVSYFAWYAKDRLQFSYLPPDNVTPAATPVSPRGLYDVLLELEDDPELGDLHDRKIQYLSGVVDPDGVYHPLKLELRFAEWGSVNWDTWKTFLSDKLTLKYKVTSFGATKTFDMMKELDESSWDEYFHDNWLNVLYVTLKADNAPSDNTIERIALRIFGDATVKDKLSFNGLKDILEDKKLQGFTGSSARIMELFHRKEVLKWTAVENAKKALSAHRNLDEDCCRVRVVAVEEVAVCADVEVKPDADIELVQALIWFNIEQYFNPPVPIYSLQEMQDAAISVENIFNGPQLKNGFIKPDDLEAASLKSVLCVSDIVNRLMDIEGVIAVNQLQLTRYDAEGNVVRGVADPSWDGVKYSPDPNKTSASWLLYISKEHQPRLYRDGSRFLFFKNGLPFLPRMNEAIDTLIQLRGAAERPQLKGLSNDLPAPIGTFRNPEDYFPVQYSFPLAYGIGPEGLPSRASIERKAQAKQLKAYLMVFEQLLGNAFTQLAHVPELFSLDPTVELTYFVKEFSDAIIRGYDEIISNEFKASMLEAITELDTITETSPEFHERRNRFLDHILARFGEQFGEYALLLTNLQGQKVALDRLINDKISFLKAYPDISRDRAKASDFTQTSLQDNEPGIVKRIKRLLGFSELLFTWVVTDVVLHKYRLKFTLKDNNIEVLTGYYTVAADCETKAISLGRLAVLARMSVVENFQISRKVIVKQRDSFMLRLKGKFPNVHGNYLEPFATETDALAKRDALVTWSVMERMMLVEHLLLRPKFPGDALYPACSDGTDQSCGNEDVYSFRLTFVMPGWITPFNTNMEFREFAERTIREETPSHLLGKICWVGKDIFEQFEDAWRHWLEVNALIDWTEERLLERVATILANNLKPVANGESLQKDDPCDCANVILTNFGTGFYDWMDENIRNGKSLDAIRDEFDNTFKDVLAPVVPCCPDFNADTSEEITELILKRYKKYLKVSYRLSIVVTVLSKMTNIYPPATLHDWDDGSDENPVRLGKTALGS